MTIKIEREAVLCVLRGPEDDDKATSNSQYADFEHTPIGSQQGFDEANRAFPSLRADSPVTPCQLFLVGHERQANACDSQQIVSEHSDDDSLSSTTTDESLASSCTSTKSVSFADELVSEVRTRPRTPTEDLPELFYTTEETQRFRIEYRLERKLQAIETEISSSTSSESENQTTTVDPSLVVSPPFRCRHRISRVIVTHHETETCYNYDDIRNLTAEETSYENSRFFDNDSFWSGSITWY